MHQTMRIIFRDIQWINSTVFILTQFTDKGTELRNSQFHVVRWPQNYGMNLQRNGPVFKWNFPQSVTHVRCLYVLSAEKIIFMILLCELIVLTWLVRSFHEIAVYSLTSWMQVKVFLFKKDWNPPQIHLIQPSLWFRFVVPAIPTRSSTFPYYFNSKQWWHLCYI